MEEYVSVKQWYALSYIKIKAVVMQTHIRKTKSYSSLVAVTMVSLLSSCAAAGNIIEPNIWLGVLDVATAVAISVFIFKGSSK